MTRCLPLDPSVIYNVIISSILEFLSFLLFYKYRSFTAELLRVIQRLNLKEQWTDLSLHFITLCTLRSTISGTRAQNHFRSIGGLEILLDGLGLPSSKFSVLKHSSISRDERLTLSHHRVLLFIISCFPFLFLYYCAQNRKYSTYGEK